MSWGLGFQCVFFGGHNSIRDTTSVAGDNSAVCFFFQPSLNRNNHLPLKMRIPTENSNVKLALKRLVPNPSRTELCLFWT